MSLLRLDLGDLDVVGPLGALLAVLLRRIARGRACAGVSANSSTRRLLIAGEEDRLVDQRVQPLLDRRRAPPSARRSARKPVLTKPG